MDRYIFVDFKEKVVENVSRVIVGKEREIELVIVAFLSGGHVLLEDIPGTGKTMLIKAFAKTLGLEFKRVQFTPDLLPTDITGLNFYSQKAEEFEFRPGPLFANIVLGDEINRATPRTQSALLEAMAEAQVTVDGQTRKLKPPFMVLATQNPVESYGTFPLPEAQLDRFLMRLDLGYPSHYQEKEIIQRNIGNPLEDIGPVVSEHELENLLSHVGEVSIQEDVMDYLVNIVNKTRNDESLELGVSPRGSIVLFKGAQAYAAISGRDYIIPEDIKYLAPYVLNHRIISRGRTSLKNSIKVVTGIVESVPVPVEDLLK